MAQPPPLGTVGNKDEVAVNSAVNLLICRLLLHLEAEGPDEMGMGSGGR